jgi:hypothetical protein
MDFHRDVKGARKLKEKRRKINMKLGMWLIEQISKMEPVEFLGLARLLGV